MNITDKEYAVMKAIDNSEYGDELTDHIWSWSVWDNIDTDIVTAATSVGGIVASLEKKGLVSTSLDSGDDASLGLTEEGADVLIDKFGYNVISKHYMKIEGDPDFSEFHKLK